MSTATSLPARAAVFADLVRRHRTHLTRVARRRAGDDADDLLQQVLTAMWASFAPGDDDRTFLVYASVSLRNAAADRARARRFVEVDDSHMADARTDTDRRVLARDLAKALDHVSPEHREVFRMREVEGMSFREIADALGIDEKTAGDRCHYARKLLAEWLGGTVKRKRRWQYTYRGRTATIAQFAAELGISPEALYCRLRRMSLEAAMEMPKNGGRGRPSRLGAREPSDAEAVEHDPHRHKLAER